MKTIYFGDSITKRFTQLKHHDNVLNFGNGGDTIIDLIGRIESIITENPDQLYIMIGINDYLRMKNYWGNPLKTNIKMMYGILLKLIHDNLPNTKVHCISILPISIDEKNEIANQEIIKLNSYIQKLTETYLFSYIDLHTHFLQNKELSSNYTIDGVHLSEEGYNLYYSLIKVLL